MIYNLENQADLSETQKKDNNTILYIDNTKENSLIQLITNARQQDFNCLDLSKRNINEFPSQLLEFTSLEYLYLEGNQLTQLPHDLFIRLDHLKWLDLRNNRLISIPNQGLANHSSLQYLLLSGNHLRTLPFELGKVKSLSALNLDGNPLNHPPIEIIKQGIKAIQQYLRDTHDDSDNESLLPDDDDDVDGQGQIRKIPPEKSKFERDDHETIRSNLPPLRVQSCKQYERTSYSARRSASPIRSRLHSGIKSPVLIRHTITNKNNDLKRNVYTTQEQSLMSSKHSDKEKQQLRPRYYIKTEKVEKLMAPTPYLINRRYTRLISKDQLEFIKNLSSEYIGKEDAVRRTYDRHIHDHIRQITDKMLKRRLEARGSIFEERRQVKLEIHELRRLVSEGKQHRPPQIPSSAKISSSDIKLRKKL